MKKKPVKKMVSGGILVDALAEKAPFGVIPQMMRNRSRTKDKDAKAGGSMDTAPQRMREGGKVTRGDGCCMRGKTKGRMI